MDPVLPLGFVLVGVSLALLVVLVFVSRAIIERMHRRSQEEQPRG